MNQPRVAFIGTGGTISSIGAGPLDIMDYGAAGNRMQAEAITAMFPQWAEVAEVIPVNFRNVVSHDIYFPLWQELAALCSQLVADMPGLAGIVIGHGTASLEETAFFLNLVLKVPVPVVITGSQRPASALSSDAGMNLVNAVRVAASPAARGMGVLVMLNDEIHAAREVTKTPPSGCRPSARQISACSAMRMAMAWRSTARRCAATCRTPSSTSPGLPHCRGWTSCMPMSAPTARRPAHLWRRVRGGSCRPGSRLAFPARRRRRRFVRQCGRVWWWCNPPARAVGAHSPASGRGKAASWLPTTSIRKRRGCCWRWLSRRRTTRRKSGVCSQLTDRWTGGRDAARTAAEHDGRVAQR